MPDDQDEALSQQGDIFVVEGISAVLMVVSRGPQEERR